MAKPEARYSNASMASSPLTPSLSVPSTPGAIERKSSWTPQARNPVSLRLYKVLSTNFDDEETRQALRTLTELYATPSTKGKEASTASLDDADDDFTQDTAASGFDSGQNSTMLMESVPGESAARARKKLRRDMENKLAEGSRKFLEALGEVDSVSTLVPSMARV